MSFQPKLVREPNPTRNIYILAAVLAIAIALIVAGLFYRRLTAPPLVVEEPRLEGALRAGAPEFEEMKDRILVAEPQATEAPRALGDIVMELTTQVHNQTGRTITGLELRGAVVDRNSLPIRERTVVVVPTQQAALEPNERISVRILIENINPEAERAAVQVDVTGVIFE